MDLTFGIEITQLFKSVAQSGIYVISTNLLYPVIIILLGLLAWSFIGIGGFFTEWRARHSDFWLIENGALKAKGMMEANNFANVAVILKKNTSVLNHIVNFGSNSPQMANTKVL